MLNRFMTNSCDIKNAITILTITCLLFGVIQVHGSDLPNCGSAYRHNCFGTFTYSNGDKYVGEFRDNRRHGQGTYTAANGDKYVGEFTDGMPNGQGR